MDDDYLIPVQCEACGHEHYFDHCTLPGAAGEPCEACGTPLPTVSLLSAMRAAKKNASADDEFDGEDW